MKTKTFNSVKYGKLTVTYGYDGRLPSYTVDKKITQEEACEIQLLDGYHPCGYGIYGFKHIGETSTWTRGNTCD